MSVGGFGLNGIVTNGLVLNLDAANRRSFVSGSTSWYDLSGRNNTGTLTNGPTYNSNNGGSIQFDGTNARVSKVNAIDTGQDFTVCTWIYPLLLGTTRRTIVSNAYPYSSRNGWILSTGGGSLNNSLFLSIGADSAWRVSAANTLTLNTWQYVSAVVTSGGLTIDLYQNGIKPAYSSTNLNTGTITYTDTQFNIGYRYVGGSQPDQYTGNIANVQIYNRALSATEILQNYNTLKNRYQ